MNTKIQELTDIIYNEGVAKGQAQADSIVAQAREQAEQILAGAQKQADEILAASNKQCAANEENMRKELKLYASQAVDSLKSEIATVVTDRIVEESVKGFTADKDAFNAFILAMAQEWASNQDIVISTAAA